MRSAACGRPKDVKLVCRAPAKRSFVGKRSHSVTSEVCRLRQAEGCEACGDVVRVERCGKSAPDDWKLLIAVNSIRSNTVEGTYGRPGRPREVA